MKEELKTDFDLKRLARKQLIIIMTNNTINNQIDDYLKLLSENILIEMLKLLDESNLVYKEAIEKELEYRRLDKELNGATNRELKKFLR